MFEYQLPAGPPEPDVESAEAARKILKDLDPLLGIAWLPFARVDKYGAPEGRYGLICTWPQADKRWEMYHNGEIGEPFDLIGMFESKDGGISWHKPGEIISDPLSVMDRALELLGECDNTRSSWASRIRKSAQHNRDLQEKRNKDVVDETVQGMLEDRRLVNHNPQIQGMDFPKE